MKEKGFKAIFMLSLKQIASRPIFWTGIFLLPLFCMLFLTNEMENGLPIKAPAAIIDRDGSSTSRHISQSLSEMELIDFKAEANSYTEARDLLQRGEIYGFFLIPENFERDLLSGKGPALTFYTNMSFYVPASLLFKSFKTTATYTKIGAVMQVANTAGVTENVTPLLVPVNITNRPLGNPGLNYAVYLCNSFVPGVFQLMILLMTCFTIGIEIKNQRSRRLLDMANGNIYKVVAGKLLPQTIIWWVLVIFMVSWLYRWQGYPMNGSWGWLLLSELMFVVAAQALGLLFFSIVPTLRLSLSVSALLGILTLSIAAYSFPVESMYGAISIFSWILPARYNFLIYIDQALNGIDIWYSRWWYIAYILIMLSPLTMMWRLRRAYSDQVYTP